MKSKEITAYFCDHCNKLYQRKHACIKHEEICHKNPKNWRACSECNHLEQIEMEHFIDQYDGSETSTMVNVFRCAKLDLILYPPKVERSWRGPYDFGDVINEPFRSYCDDRETWEDAINDPNLPF